MTFGRRGFPRPANGRSAQNRFERYPRPTMPASSPDLRDFLEASPWRACLTPAQMERVHQETTLRTFDAGSTVCLRGSPAMHWLGVVDGIVKVETIAADGRATTFAGVPAGA